MGTRSGGLRGSRVSPASGRSRPPRSATGRAHSAVAYGKSDVAPSPGHSSTSPSTSKPLARSSPIQRPWLRAKLTDSSSDHSRRWRPRSGRTSSFVAARSSSGMQSIRRVALIRKISRPPGRRSRLASGTQANGIGPDRGAVLRDREVEARVRERHGLGVAVDQRERQPVLGLEPAGRRELRLGVVDARPVARRDGRARPTRRRSRSRARSCRDRRGRPAAVGARARGCPRSPTSRRPARAASSRSPLATYSPAQRSQAARFRRTCRAGRRPARLGSPARGRGLGHQASRVAASFFGADRRHASRSRLVSRASSTRARSAVTQPNRPDVGRRRERRRDRARRARPASRGSP